MLLPTVNRRNRAFTMPELMVAIFVSILVIGALYSVFSRVQEIFRTGHNQTLVLERGRAVMDMIVRDLEVMRATELVLTENLNARDFGIEYMINAADFAATLVPGNTVFSQRTRSYMKLVGDPNEKDDWIKLRPEQYTTIMPVDLSSFDNPTQAGTFHQFPRGNNDGLIQRAEVPDQLAAFFNQHDKNSDGVIDVNERAGLPESEKLYSGDFFFTGHSGDWSLIGYGLYSPLGPRVANPLVGSLYRYEDSDPASSITEKVELHKSRYGQSRFQKVADGVVHLRLRAISALDPAGRALMEDSYFTGKHIPMMVEVEFGILEDTVVRELEPINDDFIDIVTGINQANLPDAVKEKKIAVAYEDFYYSQVALIQENSDKLHFFRQLIPIRNSRSFDLDTTEANTMDVRDFRATGFDTSRGNYHVFLIDWSRSMGLDHKMRDTCDALVKTLEKLSISGPDKGYYIVFYSDKDHILPPDPRRWYRARDGNDHQREINRVKQNSKTIIDYARDRQAAPDFGSSRLDLGLGHVFTQPELMGAKQTMDTIWILADGPADYLHPNTPNPGTLLNIIQSAQQKLINNGREPFQVHTIAFSRKNAGVDRIEDGQEPTLKRIADENDGKHIVIKPDMSLRRRQN